MSLMWGQMQQRRPNELLLQCLPVGEACFRSSVSRIANHPGLVRAIRVASRCPLVRNSSNGEVSGGAAYAVGNGIAIAVLVAAGQSVVNQTSMQGSDFTL